MKLILACGGSGGHIFPAFSVAEELRRRDPAVDLIYVCGKKDIESAIFGIVKDERIFPIESAPLSGALSIFCSGFLIKLVTGFSQSLRLLEREKPDLVVGFGGYASFATVAAAKCRGIHTLVHEQNVVPGLANRLLARVTDGIAVSFPETRDSLRGYRHVRVTGNPIRAAIGKDCREEALGFFGFSKDRTTVLVLGGSQGAESVNGIFLEAVKIFPERLKQEIQVLHLCGKLDKDRALVLYQEEGVPARCYSFFERMDLAYGAADVAIGRAGATFLAEIRATQTAALLIPYPYGNGHQRVNAEVFSRTEGSLVIEQKDVTAEKIIGFILSQMEGKSPRPVRPPEPYNARGLLADWIETVARGQA